MATYVMSDIHGQGRLFRAMLEKIGFSDADTLYIIGDVVDRGPDGIALLRQILSTPNMILLLGNHEWMLLRYYAPDVTETDIRRWDRNGNGPTIDGLEALTAAQRAELMLQLQALPSQLRLQVGGQAFHLVHGFVGETDFDRVWTRPAPDIEPPLPDARLIIGHTPVPYMLPSPEHRQAALEEMERLGTHPRILHSPGFIDIDCGCSLPEPLKTLACLRLEDLAEFYVSTARETGNV